jgi:hypothetical protein
MKKILIPRKTGEERKRNHRFSIQKKIKKYIKDGSNGSLDLRGSPVEELPDNLKVGGDLDLQNTPIEELPDNLKVGGSLNLNNTPLSKKYTEPKIRDLIEQKGGYVNKYIYT